MKSAKDTRGFTLIEILIVMALMAIIMFLVFRPVMDSFDLTRQAEVMVSAQDNARLALSVISRDLANAMYVYDNTQSPIQFRLINVNSNPTFANVYYAKIDMVLPRMHGYCTSPNHPTGVSREYERGDEAVPTCPEDGSQLELRPAEPLAPDTKIVRYFVGLADPTRPYTNKYLKGQTGSGPDNLYVLYRAEYSPFDDSEGKNRLFPAGNTATQNISDPGFFYNQAQNGWPNGETYAQAWRRISRPVVTLTRTDLVTFQKNANGQVIFDSITPTVKFAPTTIYNDPLVPTTDERDEPEDSDMIPTVYKASYGYWVLPYEITLRRGSGTSAITYTTKASGNIMGIFDAGNNLIFDISNYEDTKNSSPWGVGGIMPTNQKPKLAFTVDMLKGTVNFAFPVVDAALSENSAVGAQKSTDDINTSDDRSCLINQTANEILANSSVIASSVKIHAPDAIFGASYGSRSVLYSRTPFLSDEPGVNQYTVDTGIDATGSAKIRFHAIHGDTGLQEPLPDGKDNVLISYAVQNNKKDDKLMATYTTKSLLTVMLGMRIYIPGSGKPETVQLTNKVRLRNIAR
jgi:prepilin-type N-terminal cleavage/methylation domain-containing protein